MNSCEDCSCVKNYNDQSKFCGKVVNKDKVLQYSVVKPIAVKIAH